MVSSASSALDIFLATPSMKAGSNPEQLQTNFHGKENWTA